MTAIERGEVIYARKQCHACHRIGFAGALKAPTLTYVGSRRSPDYIRTVIKNPQAFNKKSTMPQIPLSDEEVAYLVAYLSSLQKDK